MDNSPAKSRQIPQPQTAPRIPPIPTPPGHTPATPAAKSAPTAINPPRQVSQNLKIGFFACMLH